MTLPFRLHSHWIKISSFFCSLQTNDENACPTHFKCGNRKHGVLILFFVCRIFFPPNELWTCRERRPTTFIRVAKLGLTWAKSQVQQASQRPWAPAACEANEMSRQSKLLAASILATSNFDTVDAVADASKRYGTFFAQGCC